MLIDNLRSHFSARCKASELWLGLNVSRSLCRLGSRSESRMAQVGSPQANSGRLHIPNMPGAQAPPVPAGGPTEDLTQWLGGHHAGRRRRQWLSPRLGASGTNFMHVLAPAQELNRVPAGENGPLGPLLRSLTR